MILGDRKILKAYNKKDLIIEPFDERRLGGNSYDVRLAKTLAVYLDDVLDAKKPPNISYFDISEQGFMLVPGQLYLGATLEYVESSKYLPYVDGKSSTGRLGIHIHVTAGRGDVGFKGHFTLEIEVVKPVIVYPEMPIGQLTFHKTTKVDRLYSKKKSAKYNNHEPRPMPSQMWRNFTDTIE